MLPETSQTVNTLVAQTSTTMSKSKQCSLQPCTEQYRSLRGSSKTELLLSCTCKFMYVDLFSKNTSNHTLHSAHSLSDSTVSSQLPPGSCKTTTLNNHIPAAQPTLLFVIVIVYKNVVVFNMGLQATF